MAENPKEVKAALERTEKTTGRSGAVPNTPKALLLDASSVEEKAKDKRHRWVNTADAAKVAGRVAEGYEKVPDSEGGRTVGNLTLMRQPREKYDAKQKAIRDLNERRLHAHKTEVAQVAESIERTLRDKHGIRAKILIDEA